ncbi:uncharacterized protein N7459_004730 [Penicillium hispanicum]|uniref:uncharacterized protein n=1 Tax=Penicillium hispanicum TaxID=1080232 RepID=UPI00253FC9B4|nr:uncharacterized protein N7459_004730 [Penicillium hispanicum]KAJ5584930.1 hypothetical protein N7459_004730 [Penicillium hispanicum]
MDTAVSNPLVAMGQGDQQVLHPFFRQDFGITPKPTSTPSTAPTSPAETHGLDNHLHSADNSLPYVTEGPNFPMETAPDSSAITELTTMSPEEDANASRRKRRKTDKAKATETDASLKTSLSGWLGKDSAPPSHTGFSSNTEPGCTARLSPGPLPEPPSSNSIPAAHPSAIQSGPHENNIKQRKILKLNTNGRLLSSPPTSPPGTATQKRKASRRGRSRKEENKIVAIKYTLDSDRNVAKVIDDILSGHKRLDPPIRRDVQPSNNVNEPPKPTHPFFMKKTSQKSHPVSTNDKSRISSQVAASVNPTKDVSEPKPDTHSSTKPLSLFSHRIKFPELIDPLWPPRDLVHIRPTHQCPFKVDYSRILQRDRKKAKTSTVCVSDSENAFLTSTALARKTGSSSSASTSDTRTALRLPGRHVTSGQTLQIAIDTQMSWALPGQSSALRPPPAALITKLRSNLLSSFSAFDCGQYESQLWAHKYAPKSADDVLQPGRETQVLRDWLRHLKITAVDTGKSSTEVTKSKPKRDKKRKTRRKAADKLDGFIVSSEEEASEMDNLSGSDDELAGAVTVSSHRTVIRSGDLGFCSQHGADKSRVSNAILLSGPSGCGKTASVYAVAKELDFEVFEINSGSRRSARDMLERVGDMTRNHLVHLLNEPDDSTSRFRDTSSADDSKQNKLLGFFKGQPSKKATPVDATSQFSAKPDSETKKAREQKQSLILLEEADILFDEDKQFWSGVLALISQSKRPIVITCNDESLVPIHDMSLHAILRYQKPSRDLALDYLLLVAANEGHVLKRDAVGRLYNGTGMDVRRSLMDLNFWCQVGVGSEKAGLDWILPQWPPGSNVDHNGDRVRVLSLNTYEPYMGWFNRDRLCSEGSLDKDIEALHNTFNYWGLSIQDSEDASGPSQAEQCSSHQFQTKSRLDQLELISREADYLDMRSTLDILCSGCPKDTAKDVVDITAPPPPESHRSNYVEAYPLLHADLQPEYSSLSEAVGVTFGALLSRVFRATAENIESTTVARLFNSWATSSARRRIFPTTSSGFQKVFEPIMRANYTMPLPTGRISPSFENGLAPITEDLAPYIRGIMVFDGRLKIYRDNLYAAWSQEQGRVEKRARTTRASRAALEGSDKAFTRRERWFPDDTNYYLVQGTGMPEWQTALFHLGHFQVQPVLEATGGASDHDNDSEL